MACTHNVAGSDDSDPQFMIILMHWFCAMTAGAKAIGCGRVAFDRRQQ
jgi:hypothetical protein